MKHKTWFRLVIKAIGILVLTLHLPDFILTIVGSVLSQIDGATPGSGGWLTMFERWEYMWPQFVRSVVNVAIGLYLLFGGKWIVNLCIPSNRPYCPECGYQLAESGSGNCPECGTTLPEKIAIAE
jgi:hypothetical protein